MTFEELLQKCGPRLERVSKSTARRDDRPKWQRDMERNRRANILKGLGASQQMVEGEAVPAPIIKRTAIGASVRTAGPTIVNVQLPATEVKHSAPVTVNLPAPVEKAAPAAPEVHVHMPDTITTVAAPTITTPRRGADGLVEASETRPLTD